ncbi:MAG: CDP-glycerol glycerophosphotransferase family protein [Eubacterium sp.]|nr:CDP-glycerol glycerophosphotransferase family protein [Eubacterium sp.]
MSNYFKKDSDMITVNTSLVYRVKKKILEGFFSSDESLRHYIRKRGARKFKRNLLEKEIPKKYREAAKAPVDENKVVFAEIRHPYLTNSFQVMFDELTNKYDYNVHTHFLLNNKTIRADYSKRVLDAVEDIATAKYVFVDEASNALSAMPLRKETKMIQLWHGCGAFKKFGFSTADLIFGADRKEQLRHPFYKNYSLVTISSPEVEWAYHEAMNIPEDSGTIRATGISRTDIFYDEGFKEASFEHLYEVFPQAKGKKVILYAPTFRGRVAKAKAPDMLNLDMFSEYLGKDYVVLYNFHPLVEEVPKVPERHKNFAKDVGGILGIDELLCVTDICISDYSSLVFEYSLFEKPLILFAYDLDNYCDWRGFYYDFYELAPGLIAKTNFEMIDYIQNIEERFDKKAIQDFRYKFMRSCDGHATERIINEMFDEPEKHRKECESFEHFYTVPSVANSKTPYFKQVENLRNKKLSALKLYAAATKQETEKGKIIALDIKSKELRESFKNLGITLVKSNNLETAIDEIATAENIIIDAVSNLLDALDLRSETKVILIPPAAFPLKYFGVLTKEYRSTVKKEIYELAPIYSSVNAFVASSEKTAELYKKALGKDAEVIMTGDAKSDIFFNTEKIEEIKTDLYSEYPAYKDKKIITLALDKEYEGDDTFLYEYLRDDYIIIKHFAKPTVRTEEELKDYINYYEDRIIDASKLLTRYEALAVADIVIGDFAPSVFSFISTGKPVIVYRKDLISKINKPESFLDYNEISPTPICKDVREVIKIVTNIDKYNFKKYNELKEEYLSFCGENSAEALINKLKTVDEA